MAQLSIIERRKLETLFEMGGGYVLDFSNRTLEDFVADSVGAEIYDNRYPLERTLHHTEHSHPGQF